MVGELNHAQTRLSPPLVGILIFTAGYLLAATIAALATGNSEFVFYIVVMLVLIGVVGTLHVRIQLTIPVLAALSLWGLLHMAGGLVPVPRSWPIAGSIRVLYSWWIVPDRLKYDQVIHAYGFAVTTWVCWQVLRKLVAAKAALDPDNVAPTFGFLVICAAAGMGFGAINEVIEFIATLTVPETNVGGYENTGWDLVSNMAGSIAAAALLWFGSQSTIAADDAG